jgi:hypothetical protein
MMILYLCLSFVVLSVNKVNVSSVSVEAEVAVVLQLTRYGHLILGRRTIDVSVSGLSLFLLPCFTFYLSLTLKGWLKLIRSYAYVIDRCFAGQHMV